MYQQYLNQAQATLAYLSSDELKELINDDERLEQRVNEVLKSLDQEKEMLISENRNLAEENVNKEPEFIERKGRISELTEHGQTLCASVQDKLTELKTKSGDKTPETALALLQAAAAECEETSDKLVSKLQEKEITIDEFLEQFTSARKLMHLRKLKTEKMIELLRQPNSGNRGPAANPSISGLPYSMPSNTGPGYPSSNFYPPPPGAGGVPYPTGPYQMPMPNAMFRHF